MTRVVAPGDSRKRQLKLTTQGQQLIPIVMAHLKQQDALMVAGLTAQEAVAFRRALENVTRWGKAPKKGRK